PPSAPTLSALSLHDALPISNDQPGDYRGSGCSGCHVVYANDRDEKHSGPYAKFGNTGQSRSIDPVIPKHESSHPLAHRFTRSIRSEEHTSELQSRGHLVCRL